MDTSSDHIHPARTARAVKPMIKPHSSARMVSSGISDVVIASVHSEKTCLKKLMMMRKMIIIIIIIVVIIMN